MSKLYSGWCRSCHKHRKDYYENQIVCVCILYVCGKRVFSIAPMNLQDNDRGGECDSR